MTATGEGEFMFRNGMDEGWDGNEGGRGSKGYGDPTQLSLVASVRPLPSLVPSYFPYPSKIRT